MLRKIFLKKAKKASDAIDEAQRAYDEALRKIDEIKSQSNFSLLREELIQNVKDVAYSKWIIGLHNRDNLHHREVAEAESKVSQTLNNIEECLNEMEKIIGSTNDRR